MRTKWTRVWRDGQRSGVRGWRDTGGGGEGEEEEEEVEEGEGEDGDVKRGWWRREEEKERREVRYSWM